MVLAINAASLRALRRAAVEISLINLKRELSAPVGVNLESKIVHIAYSVIFIIGSPKAASIA